jgi:hypothetical protein
MRSEARTDSAWSMPLETKVQISMIERYLWAWLADEIAGGMR